MFDAYMDTEVIDLCVALNKLPGIITTESCSGHHLRPFRIWFKVDGRIDPTLRGLFFLTRCVDRRYFKHGHQWNINLSVGDTYNSGILPTCFLLESEEVGRIAYLQAVDLLTNMNYHLNHKNFNKGFDININDFGELKTSSSFTGEDVLSFL